MVDIFSIINGSVTTILPVISFIIIIITIIMGNTINRRKSRNNFSSSFTPSLFGGKQSLERKGHKQRYELRSKTLPARNRKTKTNKSAKNAAQTLPNHRLHYGVASDLEPGGSATTPSPPNGETSRVLFLLYLIHRTWNVITDTKSKR